MWLLPAAAIAAIAGRALLGWIGGGGNAIERLGASVLAGLALVTVAMFLTGLVGAPIRPIVYLPPVAIVAIEGLRMLAAAWPRARGGWSRVRARLRSLIAPRAAIFTTPAILVVLALAVVIVLRGWLLPNRFYDSITSFDLLGKVIAAEEVFRVSLFDYTPIARGGSYPPFTALFFAFAYDMGMTSMTRAVLVMHGAFIVWMFGFARRWMGAASAWFLVAVCLTSPDFNSYLQLPLTQLPVAAFAGAGLLHLHGALGRGAFSRRELWLSALFLVLAAWTRADAAVFVVGAWLAVWIYGKHVPRLDRVLYGLPVVAVTFAWQAYAASALGESGAGRFVPYPFWDAGRMSFLLTSAGRLLFTAPGVFGLAGVAVIAALVSHAAARRSVGPLAVATLGALVVYTLMYYQTDPLRQDPLPALMTSSYRRGVTAFVLPMWMIAFLSPAGVRIRREVGRLFGGRRTPAATS